LIEGLPGAAAVTRAGSVELELAGGLADAGSGARCTPRTRFQIASVSKQFAAVAVMLLAESGTVELGEPVARWLPGSPPQWRRVTLHHLLTHTAGVRHWGDTPGFRPSQPMDPGERLTLIQQAPLLTEPGTRWLYSSPGYLLVGLIVERASGQPYPDFLTKRILAPLGLASTTAGATPAGAAMARGHRNGQPVPPWDLSAMAGTGDICSTVGDLARYTTALHSGGCSPPTQCGSPARPTLRPAAASPPAMAGWPATATDTATTSARSAGVPPASTPVTTRATCRSRAGFPATR
jgi:CubicO group peptidase (beta-lactamase class C family)